MTPPPAAPRGRTRRRVAVLLAVLGALLLGFVLLAPSASAEEATVARVVDGDTVDVRIEGQPIRVRLLNIDTPETVDPDRPKQCLGEEATELTSILLPAGEVVELEYDQERTDRYGRTLAHVRLADGAYVSDELAREGLGIPVVYGENDARFDEVQEALREGSDNGRGFFDPGVECSVAATERLTRQQATEASNMDAGSSAAEAAGAAAAVEAIVEAQEETIDAVTDGSSIAVKAFRLAGRSADLRDTRLRVRNVTRRHGELVQVAEDRAKDESRRKARAERQAAAERDAAAELEAAEAREAAERAAERAAREAAPQPAPEADSGESYPGYTGPRCYAPGGKTWRPC